MITAHFDLQNIIAEMDSSTKASEAPSQAGAGDFSATMKRVTDSPNEYQNEDSTLGDEDHSQQGTDVGSIGSLEDIDTQSGNVLPLLPNKHSGLNQVTLESKRPILIGSSNLTDSNQSVMPELNALESMKRHNQETGEGTGKAHLLNSTERDHRLTNQAIKKDMNAESKYLEHSHQNQGKSDPFSNLLKNSESNLDNSTESGVNGPSRVAEIRPNDSSSIVRTSIDLTDNALDIEAMQKGLRNIVKNQIISSFEGKNVSVKMILSPESLGEIQVDLVFSKGKDLEIMLRPETAEVAKLIQSNSASLREQLSLEHKGPLSLNVSQGDGQNPSFGGNKESNSEATKNSLSVNTDKNEHLNSESDRPGVNNDSLSTSLIDIFA